MSSTMVLLSRKDCVIVLALVLAETYPISSVLPQPDQEVRMCLFSVYGKMQ